MLLPLLFRGTTLITSFLAHHVVQLAWWAVWLVPFFMISQRLRMEHLKGRLRRREELFTLISENAADMIAVVDVNGRRLYNSTAYKKVLGYSSRELGATSAYQQIHPEDIEKVKAATEEARRTGVGKRLEYRVRHKNGSWLVLESTASAIRNAKGEVEKLVIVNRDITERKRVEEKLEHNALHDGLTDLPNRTLFLERLQRAFERARKNPAYQFAVLFVDIDGFKVFNDTMGHSVGDELIIEIGCRLADCLRFEDTLCRPISKAGSGFHHADEVLARLGGDEFTILVGSIHDPSDAMRVANRIQDALGTFSVAGREVFISASIGVALSTMRRRSAEELLRDADMAMYRAKTLGKARCEFFDQEMRIKAVRQLDLETDLRRAIDEGEFRLHFQPIVRLEAGRITGVEALLRWQRQDCLVFPDSFIGTAESSGLIVPLGKWILREACRHAQLWQPTESQDAGLSVTVNVSPKQFAHPHLVSDVEEALIQTGIDPRRLHLEITESVAMADSEKTKQVLSQLKNLGVGICLDDFGTGQSSLGRLRRFPVDIIKIDRSFISHMDSDAEARQIARLIVEFAHTLNLQVIAEGIETSAQVDYLKTWTCEFGQGYFFSKPLDQHGIERWLAAAHGTADFQNGSARSHSAGAE
ncbi:MAG TPA: EAL domain-containing protein [Terriglobales bacterium]|nr:EAL domain-containing protein [Terriglobales bacterium]